METPEEKAARVAEGHRRTIRKGSARMAPREIGEAVLELAAQGRALDWATLRTALQAKLDRSNDLTAPAYETALAGLPNEPS